MTRDPRAETGRGLDLDAGAEADRVPGGGWGRPGLLGPYRWRSGGEAGSGGLGPALSPAGTSVLPFRRRAVKPRRQRRSLWVRLLRPLATAVVLVAAPVALAGWMLTSPRFALRAVEVAGSARVPAGWVEARVAPLLGQNLLRLRLARVERALVGHPWVAGVAIEKRLPDGLAVTLEERVPAVRVRREDGVWLADCEGRSIVAVAEGAGAGEEFLLVVPSAWDRPALDDGAPEAAVAVAAAAGPATAVPAALELAAEIARSQPVWAAGLERMESLGQGEFRLVTTALPFPVLARVGELEPAARQLGRVLPALVGRRPALASLEEVDLRFAGRLIFRPAPPPQTGTTVRHEDFNRREVG